MRLRQTAMTRARVWAVTWVPVPVTVSVTASEDSPCRWMGAGTNTHVPAPDRV